MTDAITITGPDYAAALAEAEQLLHDQGNDLGLLQERLAALELEQEEWGWQRLGEEAERDFSRAFLGKLWALSRLMFLKNPLIGRAIRVQAYYVFGQGLNCVAPDDRVNGVVQAFLEDRDNQAALSGHQARLELEHTLQVFGNVFFCLFTDRLTGRVRVRMLPPEEVQEIASDPDDAKTPWFYRRTWQQQTLDPESGRSVLATKTAFYPDWRYQPEAGARRRTIGEAPVLWETPVYHVKAGGLPDMAFGVPELFAAFDWARAHGSFLSDWATIVRAYSRFAFNLTTTGGARGVSAAKAKLNTTLAAGGVLQRETNPPPGAGSMFVSGDPNVKLEPIRTGGATVAAGDGRHLLLNVAAVAGIPETFFGDASVGTVATAEALDRPTELKFQSRQVCWADVHTDLLQFVVDAAARAPRGALRGYITARPGAALTDDGLTDDGRLALDQEQAKRRRIDVTFPKIVTQDVAQRIAAIVSGATLDGHPIAPEMPKRTITKQILSAWGEDDVDELLDEVYDEDGNLRHPPEPALPAVAPGQTAPAAAGDRGTAAQIAPAARPSAGR